MSNNSRTITTSNKILRISFKINTIDINDINELFI